MRSQTGELNGALSDLDEALRLNPNNPRLYAARGELLFVRKELGTRSNTLLMGSDNEAQADFNVLLQADRALWQKRIDERTAAVKKLVPNQ